MAFDFNAKDVFKMAREIERNGVKLYSTAAEKVENADHRDLLLDLAKMEEQHEETFKEMESDLTKKEQTETVFDPDNEALLYLKALADTRIFAEKEIDMSSMEAILKAALGAEKDSIVFYLGMKELVPEKYGKNRLDAIIKEEMSHVRLLSKELAALK
ncbi:MAG: ferritin family protein [Desulfobacterales bacterium]|nr:ferritin family protein [Desulfobacterales bacterium]